MKKINTILIGLGRIASTLEKDKLRNHPCTHSGVLFSKFGREKFSLQGIYDTNKEKILEFQSDWKLKNIITNLQDLKKIKIDLGIIATNSESHFTNLEDMVKMGIPNLLIEKPLCLNQKELSEILKLKKKYKFNLWVNHERRYHAPYQLAREIYINKTYGELRTIKASILTSFRDPGHGKIIGPLFHDGTHVIDFLDFLFEKSPKILVTKSLKKKKSSKIAERVISILEYEKDSFVFLEIGGKRNYFQFEIDMEWEKARMVLSNDGHRFYLAEESKLYTGFKSLREKNFPTFTSNPWINLYNEIFLTISGKNSQISGSLEANRRIFNLLQDLSK
jgi:predicted dehydrogenase